jgi:hypothetical protein
MLWGILFLEQLLKPFHSSVTANPNKRQQNWNLLHRLLRAELTGELLCEQIT